MHLSLSIRRWGQSQCLTGLKEIIEVHRRALSLTAGVIVIIVNCQSPHHQVAPSRRVGVWGYPEHIRGSLGQQTEGEPVRWPLTRARWRPRPSCSVSEGPGESGAHNEGHSQTRQGRGAALSAPVCNNQGVVLGGPGWQAAAWGVLALGRGLSSVPSLWGE